MTSHVSHAASPPQHNLGYHWKPVFAVWVFVTLATATATVLLLSSPSAFSQIQPMQCVECFQFYSSFFCLLFFSPQQHLCKNMVPILWADSILFVYVQLYNAFVPSQNTCSSHNAQPLVSNIWGGRLRNPHLVSIFTNFLLSLSDHPYTTKNNLYAKCTRRDIKQFSVSICFMRKSKEQWHFHPDFCNLADVIRILQEFPWEINQDIQEFPIFIIQLELSNFERKIIFWFLSIILNYHVLKTL